MNHFKYIALLLWLLLPATAFESSATYAPKPNKRVVVIDAGHGGKDSGSLGKKAQEKNIALSIALKVGDYLETHLDNVKVIYTRDSDVFLELHERAQIANDAKADIFISIHCNSLLKRNENILGSETYVMGLHTAEENLNVAKRENSVILLENNYEKRYDGYNPNSPEAHIILSMYQNAYLKQSLSLAEKIEGQFTARSQRPSRGVKQAGFMVLKASAMPSVLVETGFLSNTQDENYLLSEKGQVYTASAIYRALREYLEELDMGKINLNKTTQFTQNPANNQVIHIPPVDNSNATPNSIVYRLQLASATKPIDINATNLRKVQGLQTEFYNGAHKYLVGNYQNLTQAQNELAFWRKNGFPDAFLITYKGGKRQ